MTETAAAPSRFLPTDFNRSAPLAILAGQGLYPRLVADRARATGLDVRLVAFADETDPDLVASFPEDHRRTLKVGQLGHTLDTLRAFGCREAIMAGRITPRKLFQGLHPDLKAMAVLFRLRERNAESIFGAVCAEMAAIGVRVLDARAFLDDHLATLGCMTDRRSHIAQDTLDHGVQIAREVARLDIGQGVVVASGTVLAVEAFEGTNEMLRRAGTFPAPDKLFVKAVKPRQDWRIDVPVFGERTIEVLAEARIAAAALETDGVLLLDKPRVLAAARAARIELLGFTAAT